MDETEESGTGDGEGISVTEISYSVDPTASGPGYCGNVGIGLIDDRTMVEVVSDRVTQ